MKYIQYSDLVFTGKDKPVASGHFCDMNFSRIYDTLIREAARNDSYASDLAIDLYPIIKAQYGGAAMLDDIADKVIMFGFRDSGVDHDNFIKARLKSPAMYGTNPYRAIYLLEIHRCDNRETTDYVEVYFKRAC